jgi:putative transposase
MVNTYSQICIHAVFAVKGRNNLITQELRDSLPKYISGIITNKNAKSLAVKGWMDHVHIFFGMSVTTCIADFMSAVEASSSAWINEQRFLKQKFSWQSGYDVFSFAKSQRDQVINYILNQQEHHRLKTFKEEYLKMLQDFSIEYNENYLLEFYES